MQQCCLIKVSWRTIQLDDNNSNEPPQPDEPPGIDIDVLRDKIWDNLFKSKAAHPLGEIALLVGRDLATIRIAINHEWSRVAGDRVSLAYVIGNKQPPQGNPS
jgi:hypothetical protein